MAGPTALRWRASRSSRCNPELIKRYWKASIRAYQFMRIKENFPFFRFVEAKLRVNNPDEAERSRDLFR